MEFPTNVEPDTLPPVGSLDERKFEHEVEAKSRELALKEREVAAREREVATKEQDLKRSRWWNPTVIGFFATVIAGLLVARVNNANSQQVERLRAQSNLVLEAIRTGPDSACKNLIFLVGLGLIDDTQNTIRDTCVSAPKGPPSLPSNPFSYEPLDIGGWHFRGEVLDAVSGAHLPKARVVLLGDSRELAEVTTDDAGNFDAFLSPAVQSPPLWGLSIRVEKTGYLTSETSARLGQINSIKLTPSQK